MDDEIFNLDDDSKDDLGDLLDKFGEDRNPADSEAAFREFDFNNVNRNFSPCSRCQAVSGAWHDLDCRHGAVTRFPARSTGSDWLEFTADDLAFLDRLRIGFKDA